MNQNLQMHRNVKITAADDVPADVRRVVASRIERALQQGGSNEFVHVTIAKRKNPNEIYDVRIMLGGEEFQHDFERGDLDSERFDIWLGEQGKHLEEGCWCRHSAEEHTLPQCTGCEG